MKIFAGYNTDWIGTIDGQVTTGSVFNSYSVTGSYFTGFSSSVDFVNYGDVLIAIASAMSGNVIGNSNISLRYDLTSNRVILSSSIALKHSFGPNTQNILGMSSSYTSSFVNVITGSKMPWYIWESTNAERSHDSEIYEAEAVFDERIADSGRTYSVGNNKTANYRDWSFVNEPQENMFRDKATDTVPFTYDMLLRELRKGPTAFGIFKADATSLNPSDGTCFDGLYEMRAEAFNFKPKQKFPDFFLYWDIDLKTRLLYRPNQANQNNFTNLPSPTGSLAQVIPNMILWLNANMGGEFNSNLTLNKVYDQSPLNSYSISNTASYVAFSGSNSRWSGKAIYHMTSSISGTRELVLSGSSTASVSSSGVTIVAIGEFIDNHQDATYYRPIVETFDSTTSDHFFIGAQNNQQKKLVFYAEDASVGVTAISSSQLNLNEKFVAIGLLSFASAQTGSLYINGSSTGTGYVSRNATSPVLPASFKWSMATTSSVTNIRMPGMGIAEYQVYGRVLGTDEINKILTYASQSYGITSSLL